MMKVKAMVERTGHVDDELLEQFLFGEEDSFWGTAAVSHIETCDHCLGRLKQLSGAEQFEREAAELLRDDSNDTVVPASLSGSMAPALEEVTFLGPPTHPEMLGRLGRYEIERQVGAGGMGVVLKGFDTELNRPVAVKVLAQHLAHSGAARQRFAREARAAAAVVHENVVAIHNVETEGEVPFLVMQFVPGESLQARVDREGPLDSRQILRIGIQAAAGLAAAHEQGVVHRDVKPANILMEQGVERILLTDFGLARTVDDASLTHTGVIAGTPHYMSPEQAHGESCDYRTDLFSLGSVMYFMATGHPPFRADRAMGILHRICTDPHRSAWQINPDLDDELSDAIDRLLQKKPSRRFSSASALRECLTHALERIQAPRPWWVRRLRRVTKRLRGTFQRVGIAAVVLIAATLLWVEFGPATVNTGAAGHTKESRHDARDTFATSEPPAQEDTTLASESMDGQPEPAVNRMIESSTADLDLLAVQIRERLEASPTAAKGKFLNVTSSDWQQDADQLRSRLDRLESANGTFVFPRPVSP